MYQWNNFNLFERKLKVWKEAVSLAPEASGEQLLFVTVCIIVKSLKIRLEALSRFRYYEGN